MAITKAFSSQGTTIEIFKGTPAQHTTLETAIANALTVSETSTRLSNLKSAYTNFFQPALARKIISSGATVNSTTQADGYFSGTWSKTFPTIGTIAAHTLSGTFSSVGVDSTGIYANFYLSNGTMLEKGIYLSPGDISFSTGNSDKGTLTTPAAKSAVISGGSAFAASITAGNYSGTWYVASTGQGGTFVNTTTSTTGGFTADFTLLIGDTTATVTPAATDLTILVGGGATTGATVVATGIFSTQMIATTPNLTFNGVSGAAIGKITAAGDTGKTYTMISEKLINEAGTYKGKGSVDEGDFTIDYLHIPTGDPGQDAMELAFEDTSSSANRVFRITHLSSSSDGTTTNAEKVYFVGLVTELKKSRGTIDKIVPVKAKIAIQNGLVEDDPA